MVTCCVDRGEFGLFIGADLQSGSSGSSDTFFNAPLSREKTFQVSGVRNFCDHGKRLKSELDALQTIEYAILEVP